MTKIKNFEQLMDCVPKAGGIINEDILLQTFPSLEKLKTTPQDPTYHAEGDVWTHTKMVIKELLNDDFYDKADLQTKFVLFYSALLHDISKPQCTKHEEDGRISSKGHSGMGAIDTRILLWEKEVPFELRERICRIVSTHQVPFFALGHDRRGRRPEFTLHSLSWEGRVCDLTTLARADMKGRVSIHQKTALDDLDLFEMMAREEQCWDKEKYFVDSHTRLQYMKNNGILSLDHSFHQNSGSKVIVMAGLPASGKNTYVEQNHPGLDVVSFDDAKASLGLKQGDNMGQAVHLAIDKAKSLLREHQPFVWNATHLTPDMRQKTLSLLYQYQAEVQVVYLEQPKSVLFSRNDKRDSTLSNKALKEMLLKWNIPLPYEAHQVQYVINSTAKPEYKKMKI